MDNWAHCGPLLIPRFVTPWWQPSIRFRQRGHYMDEYLVADLSMLLARMDLSQDGQ